MKVNIYRQKHDWALPFRFHNTGRRLKVFQFLCWEICFFNHLDEDTITDEVAR